MSFVKCWASLAVGSTRLYNPLFPLSAMFFFHDMQTPFVNGSLGLEDLS